eukprot:TRINITY_DN9881_c0_g1_i1.p1 TRINITY_DN9881_c0_g1~~TRINITY_DN9881_c0_g1_i1.p1  ORF type:complete len:337 (-),score=66.93 TRINITY_DN9881_c0_g1_i1:3-986(-)
MSTTNTVKVIYGAYPVPFLTLEERKEVLDTLEKYKVKDLDTAYIYPNSEKALGELGAPSRFIIHTKAPGFNAGPQNKENISAGAKKQFTELGTDQVETYFLHSPDPKTPLSETLEAIQELYTAGRFKYFGVSNFKPQQVQEIYDHNKSKGWVLPTVYQGNYNAVARHSESELFPLLRKLGIRFYAYSPLAGGFLVKSAQAIKEGTDKGRFDVNTALGQLYNKLYNRKKLLEALDEWEAISKDFEIPKLDLGTRWVFHNSFLSSKYGDGVIIGANGASQLKSTLDIIAKGPLDDAVVKRIDKVWELVKDEAPLDNYCLLYTSPSPRDS